MSEYFNEVENTQCMSFGNKDEKLQIANNS